MKRILDIVVGLFLILFGLFLQLILAGVLTVALDEMLRYAGWLRGSPELAAPHVIAFISFIVLVNVMAAYQFWWQRRTIVICEETGGKFSGGLLLLIPRGIHRMVTGTETPNAPACSSAIGATSK